jgi:ureidoglycolate lyase
VKPVILTEESIKGYGYLLSESKKDPILNNEHFKYISDVYKLMVDGEMTVGILFGRKREMVLKNLERHKETVEILVQLENDSVVFFAKQNDQRDSIKDIKAFYFNSGQAVVLNQGTWHWGPFPIAKPECKTLIVFKEGTSQDDCEIRNLEEDVIIDL